MQVRFFCPNCAAYNRMSAISAKTVCLCIVCKKAVCLSPNDDFFGRNEVTQCLFCRNSWFYNRRDFNKAIGCAIVLAAIVLSFWTYGISLIVAWLIDWFLFKRLPRLVVCYVCDAEYKGASTQTPDFDLHLHEKYKKYREAYQTKQ